MIQSLLIKDAEILNLDSGVTDKKDIYIERGVVERIADEIDRRAQYELDAKGLLVTPGLVDVHSHIFYDSELIGVDPQKYNLPNGVTYCIDQGSAGADNYEDFRKRVIASTDVRVRAFLNCSKIGMPVSSLADTGEMPGPGELYKESDFDREAFINTYRKYEDELLGIKIRLTPNICPKNPLGALEKAVEIAEELKVRVSVHANGAAGLKTEDVLGLLRKGDIFTHTYHKSDTGIIDEDGNLKECVQKAREREVIFDTGHGVNSLSFEVMKRATEIGFIPDTISTDLHNLNVNGPVFDLPTTISKFLCRGLSVHEALARCIVTPVRLLGLTDKSTDIREGQIADLAAFELRKGNFVYQDAMKVYMEGNDKLEARFTVLGEKLFMRDSFCEGSRR